MASIGDITGTLQLNTSGFVAGVNIAKKSVNGIRDGLNTISTTAAKVESGIFSLKNALLGLGAGAIVKNITDTAMQFQSMQQSLNSATGGAVQGAKAMEYVRSEAERLGLSLEAAASSYTTIAAAARGTALEGKNTADIFTSVSEAATVMGLSADATQGSLLAISQMISKGNVSAEELRGQLGERLPGAFQIAAQSMGVTTAELDKMLQQGQVVAADFLPGFAQALRDRFGKDVPDAASSARAEFNRLGNSIVELKLAVANSGLLDFVTALAKSITILFQAAGKVMKESITNEFQSSSSRAKEMQSTIAGMIPVVGKFVGVFSDGLYAIKLAFLGLRLVINKIGEGIMQWINHISTEFTKVANDFIRQTNSIKKGVSDLFGTEYKPIELIAPSSTKTLDEFSNRANDIQMQIEKMLSDGLPSERIAEYTAKMKDAYTAVSEMKPTVAPDIGGAGPATSSGAVPVATGSTSGGSGKLELESSLEQLKEQFMSEEELLMQSLENRRTIVSDSFAAGLIDTQERNELMKQIEADYQNGLTELEKKASEERIKLKEKEAMAKAQAEQTFWSDITSLMSSNSKTMFEIGKKAAIARAIIDGWKAATAAWAAGMSVGGPAAPAVAAAYTAASLAKTGAMIASLRSSSFSGGAGGSAVGGASVTQPSSGGINETIAAEQQQEPITTREVVVDLGREDKLLSTDAVRRLIEEIGQASQDMGITLRTV